MPLKQIIQIKFIYLPRKMDLLIVLFFWISLQHLIAQQTWRLGFGNSCSGTVDRYLRSDCCELLWRRHGWVAGLVQCCVEKIGGMPEHMHKKKFNAFNGEQMNHCNCHWWWDKDPSFYLLIHYALSINDAMVFTLSPVACRIHMLIVQKYKV